MADYEVRELSFKGHPYKICCLNRMPQDPSHFSHEDESGVRDRDWDIKPGDVVFDIGSAYGSYALTALAAGAHEAWCWNPNREEMAVLNDSIRKNNWRMRFEEFDNGLWSEEGRLRDTDNHFIPIAEVGTGEQRDKIREDHFWVTSLDRSLLQEPERIDWMKLDVEGAEVEVLKGAEQTIRRFRPRILVEQHRFKDATIAERVTALLETFGYRLVRDTPYHAVSHSLYEPEEK